MSNTPIAMQWDGEVMVPASPFWAARANKAFAVGETYRMAEHHERSQASHNHYFAAVNEAWKNLPDYLLAEYPTAEHLRKKILIQCGYADERSIVLASKQEAQKVAAFVKPADDYSIVVVRDDVVRVYSAKSQSLKAMGKADFALSKQAVLDKLDDLLNVSRGTIYQNTAVAA